MTMKEIRPMFYIGMTMILVALIAANILHEETDTIIIQRVDMQQMVSGTKDGMSTSYHYMVYSDKGLYTIDQSGILFAHPELVDSVHAGDTVRVTSRGYYIPQIGLYRHIVDVSNYKMKHWEY